MNQENVKEELAKKNDALSIMNCDLKENSGEEGNEKGQREIGMLRTKSKRKITMRPGTTYAQCFSGGNFASQYEDECPVNYSLKYSETESCKCTNKCETMKKKFKDYTDYAETDLDQPTDFSLKYAEKTYDDENKNIAFNYYNNHKVKFKEYTDYVETDLDQPTDFTLKYRESAEEDIKNAEFTFYENEERKPPNGFGTRTVPEDLPCERLAGRFASQDETPLMFSRSSSLNSLSSFVHITQSIPDDRSSVVSDFSRMTSGIISPSELPDSPTQTAPSSPKRVKPGVVTFSSKPDFMPKQSVFEDDVATYKQEDTPIEFSRATSLSSLNIENPIKSELVIKQSPGASIDMSKDENQNAEELVHSEHTNQDLVPEKVEQEKGKFELASVLEVDESLFADRIGIDIQINCRKPKPNSGRLMVANEGSTPFRQNSNFHLKSNCRLKFHNESRKGYAPYELSDDAVHTYHAEGTPANVSHAGSNSDLSALSIVSGIPLSGADDNSDSECFFPESTESMCKAKTDPLRNKMKVCDGSETVGRNSSKGAQLDYPRKDQLTAKDETASFAIESSSCKFLGSSLGDLTVNVINPPLSITRVENFEEASSQLLSPLRNVSPQSPNSIVFEEADDIEKGPEEFENEFVSSETVKERNDDAWDQSSRPEQTEQSAEDMNTRCSTAEFSSPANIDFDSNLPLTAFEEALLEECIRLGMPRKRRSKQLQETHFKLNDEGGKTSEEGELSYSKSGAKEGKWWNGKKCSDLRFAGCESQLLCGGASTPNSVHGENFDFDSSEPLTPFEEVLLEQCIQLGMPPKRKQSEETHLKHLDEGAGDFDCDFAGLITPLETALVEQCIRLGMPQKKGQKRENGVSSEESHKAVPCLAVHLNRLRLNSENEKDKDSLKKCESCPCGKRHAYRRRNTTCRRTKGKSDHFKVESCPV